ncbi:protein phosphatase 1 regulatory subunit 12A-like isoform X2 [Hydractinia symbiolongicarpus]|uniref:protein phosphatase 1 regulatory subunit 12A-like isoform X2 n=1 Tax=Hydractinia symbiolongicarpus TaxID=13093 RepID=UPI00254B7BB0|nr:protein phosphatase 1 regulatory subunit 12A-like isoform X2 [Hydractinia symbiolongicarpus]
MVEKMSSDLGTPSRASNALLRRAQAIKDWLASDTAKEKPVRLPVQFTIKFDKGTVFLSAVASGDLEETERLLKEGVDIDYTNIDGLTALHQACIDENDDMVKLLLNKGANIEACDNEGWTPLHAAASAGNIDIAQILIDNGADLSAVNNEGEVPLDLAEEEEMEEFLSEEIDAQGVEVEDARNEEERKMIEDANGWINNKEVDEILDWQGATALHVAAAKGYNKVISLLLQIGNIDVNVRDNDGWTPLHAAVHWGSKTACELLTEAGADFELKNSNGQTPCDLSEPEFLKTAENCRKLSKELAKKPNFTKNKRMDITIDMNDNSMIAKEINEMLKKTPVRPIVKGSRANFNNNGKNTEKITNDNKVSKNKSEKRTGSGESDHDSDSENRPASTKNISSKRSSTAPSTTSSRTSLQSNPLRTSSALNRDEKKDNKQEVTITSVTSKFQNRFKETEKEEPKKAEPASRTTFTARTRPTSGKTEPPKSEEKKPEESRTSRFGALRATTTSSSITVTKDDKEDDTARNRLRGKIKLDENDTDSRFRKNKTTNDENDSTEPDNKRSDTTERTRGRVSTEDENSRMSIAERLRKKNAELLSSTDRTSERSSFSDRTSAISDRYSTSSSIRDRTSNRNSTSSSDTGDTKDSQRKLDQALKDVQEYKQKYEKIKQEKEALERQLEQYKEDIDKMQELKNDNLRLKDENGALIRVISKLSRTPAS